MKQSLLNKKRKDKFTEIFEIGIIVILILLILYNSYQMANNTQGFWRGFHNVDLSWNFERIQNELNRTITDIANDGVERPIEEYYFIGSNQMHNSYDRMMLLSLLQGIYLFVLGLLLGGRLNENKS